MASFLIPPWGPGSPVSTHRLPVHHTSTAVPQHKESPMITKFLSAFASKNDTNHFSHLPEQIQAEIRDANEATSVYDIK